MYHAPRTWKWPTVGWLPPFRVQVPSCIFDLYLLPSVQFSRCFWFQPPSAETICCLRVGHGHPDFAELQAVPTEPVLMALPSTGAAQRARIGVETGGQFHLGKPQHATVCKEKHQEKSSKNLQLYTIYIYIYIIGRYVACFKDFSSAPLVVMFSFPPTPDLAAALVVLTEAADVTSNGCCNGDLCGPYFCEKLPERRCYSNSWHLISLNIS